MWESPIYKFKTKIGKKDEEIFIDVTGSAPNFTVPGTQLEGTFKNLLSGLKPSDTTILDFGAAKLRNTVYLLKKGYTVYACEYEDLFKRSQQADDFLKEAKQYPNFKRLMFPHDFIDVNVKFDVILLVNVLNVMPVPLERFLVLKLCREKISDNGKLLWYTQHGAYEYDKAYAKLNDGIVTGKGRQYHMFYRDFSRKEIHDMLIASGFSFNKQITFPSSGSNQAYAFNISGDVLIEDSLGLSQLLKSKSTTKSIPRQVRWEVDDEETHKTTYESKVPTKLTKLHNVNILDTYLKELDNVKAGKQAASRYHQLIFNILKTVFDYSLKNPIKEEKIAKKTKRVDITFSNDKENGFFKRLDESYHVQCPNIFIECKNYKHDLKAPEFDQLRGRFTKVRGVFGILVCRKMENKEAKLKHQQEATKDEKYIIVLEDSDIKKIVKLKIDNKIADIDKFLEGKFKELI